MKLNIGTGRKFSANRMVAILLVLLAVVAAGSVYLFVIQSQNAEYEATYVEHSDDLRVLAQVIAQDANKAAEKLVQDHKLWQSRNEFERFLMMIRQGMPMTGLPAAPPSEELDAVVNAWMRLRAGVDAILASQDQTSKIATTVHSLNLEFDGLGKQFDVLVDNMIEAGSTVRQVTIAQEQQVLVERILRQLQLMNGLNGNQAVSAADALAQASLQIGRNIDALIQGDASRGITSVRQPALRSQLADIEQSFTEISDMVVTIFSGAPELFAVWEAVNTVNEEAQNVMSLSNRLAEHFGGEHFAQFTLIDNQALTWIFLGGVMIALIISIGTILVRSTQIDLERTSETNEQNQNAILRLLDELADLADGDLTTQATVTEDFTGAIADSINFAIDQMRDLVQAINSTALQVSSSAQESQATAMHLAEASEHQAQEIAGASAAVNEMAVSIDQVSANAAESTAVAERSVAIAKKGADVVQATINGMDNIREQIQETAKRIKRLGESSQEIGDIVSLINDIADQTNILALNAAIQASMAGDAGRGFAVVADEVQRLAERSSAATKQIEALVKTIQTDTNEAVISMEQTTAEVVRGARLAQDAGVALEEIENVSKNLADLIQNISNAARQQASSAGHISNTMNVIQEITSQTSAGTMATAKSIGNLNQLANEMRASVAGFKLPEDEIESLLEQQREQDDDLMSA